MLPLPKKALALGICACTILSCSKHQQQPSSAPAILSSPVDTITGSYSGYLHVYHQILYAGDPGHPYLLDTTYPITVIISKIAADTFSVGGGITYTKWIYGGFTTSATHIAFAPSNIYISQAPFDQLDSLIFTPAADSIYYKSIYRKPGGATSENKVQTFSGKK
jgi:hypothetical protein